MRRTLLAGLAGALLLALCSVVPLAQSAGGNVRFGTWKLDPAKSTFSPGPAPKSQTAKLDPVDGIDGGDGGMRTVADRVEADGSLTHFEWTVKFDGKDYPVKGDPGRDAVSVTKIDDFTLVITNKKAGQITTTIRAVYARDGKSRTETTTGTNAKGQKVENVTVWTKS